MAQYSILVNTCDKFEDCWDPFFKLFSIYWPNYNGKIYLNTEYKDYSYPGLNIVSLKVCLGYEDRGKISWSECLIRALDKVDEEVILYLQEDYFLKAPVKDDLVTYFSKLIKDEADVHCLHLTDQAVKASSKSSFEHLRLADKFQKYRVSCQAALWKKGVLKSYLRPYESAWQFEEFGSKRASKDQCNFYVVDDTWVQLDKFEVIPYLFTGVVQGRWFEPVVDLFEKHCIKIDYTRRGFLKDAPKKPISKKVSYQFERVLVHWKSLFYN